MNALGSLWESRLWEKRDCMPATQGGLSEEIEPVWLVLKCWQTVLITSGGR